MQVVSGAKKAFIQLPGHGFPKRPFVGDSLHRGNGTATYYSLSKSAVAASSSSLKKGVFT